MAAYYNEFEPYAAEWLRNLIKAGLIADGEVDTRSIVDVRAEDLREFTQCHFFAGIGGWSYAARLAGLPDDYPLWTGSCPCQPFSSAGKQKGKADDRHLWPVWFRLIRECRPAKVYGEQVASAIAHGWLDDAFDDLEGEGYACGAAVLPACSVGAPHRRDRLWFVADANREGEFRLPEHGEVAGERVGGLVAKPSCELPHGIGAGTEQAGREEHPDCSSVGNAKHDGSHGAALTGSDRAPIQHDEEGAVGSCEFAGTGASDDVPGERGIRAIDDRSIEWISCPDGKSRPVKPGLRLLAHGVPGRVGQLRAYGNAIVPQVAAEFIRATQGDLR